MALTLYRKYRPQTFKEMVGQNHIKITIQNELESDKVAHAYLFSGPRGLGKTTTARLLAKSVNCLNRKPGSSEPCNNCNFCQDITRGNLMDVIEIDAASHTGVDNVRENIIEHSRFTPSNSKFKVFIIDEVHMLSTSAFNALLKTLEEPPAHAIFILATTEIHKVPQTIISRCQHFEFRPVNDEEIIKRLEHIVLKEEKKIDQEILENISYYSSGSVRDAESLLGQVLSLDDKHISADQAELVLPRARFDLAIEMLEFLNRKDASGAIKLVNELVQDGVDLEKFTDNLIEISRKVLLIKVHEKLSDYVGGLSKNLEEKANRLSHDSSLNFLVRSIEILINRRKDLRYAEIIQLPLELAILEIIGDDKSNDDIASSAVKKQNVAASEASEERTAVKKEVKKSGTLSESVAAGKKFKIDLSMQQISSKWQEVLESIKRYNHSLASTLKLGKLDKVHEDGALEIIFEHDFHSQRVNDNKNKKILEEVLKDIFGLDLTVKTVIVKNLNEEAVETQIVANDDEDDVTEIASAFGGQVIN